MRSNPGRSRASRAESYAVYSVLLKRRSLPVVSAQGIGLLRFAGFMSSALVPPLTVVTDVALAKWGSATRRPG